MEDQLLYTSLLVDEIKKSNKELIKFLLKDNTINSQWIKAYFPFTEPSFELETFFNNKWIEMLGCGFFIRSYSLKSFRLWN